MSSSPTRSRLSPLFLVLSLYLAVAPSSPALAQALGRLSGKVVDPDGQPVPGAQVTVTMEGQERAAPTVETETSKKGKFVISVPDATRVYRITFKKEGFSTLVERVKLKPGETLMREFTMPAPVYAAETVEVPREERPETPARPADPALVSYNEGVDAFRSGDLETAIARFQVAIQRDGSLAMAYSSLSTAYLRAERYQQAAEAAERTLELDPTDYKALNVRYQAYSKLGNETMARKARGALRAAGGAEDAARRAFNEGARAYNTGDLARAKALLTEALALDETLLPAHLTVAKIDLREGRYALALASAGVVLEQEPHNPQALRVRFDASRGLGDPAAIRTSVRDLMAAFPATVTEVDRHAAAFFDSDAIDAAVVLYEEMLVADPGRPRAHYTLGLCYLRLGRNQDARKSFQKFLQLSPDDPDAEAARALVQGMP